MTRDRQAGLTLIEMLVVLTIIAIASGVGVLGLGALDRGARAEDEAMRLADRLQLASDAALVSGAPMSLVWDARGYRFVHWDARSGEWRAAVEPLLAVAHRLPGTLTLRQSGAAKPQPLLISPDRASQPVLLAIAGGTTEWTVAFDGIDVVAGSEVEPDG